LARVSPLARVLALVRGRKAELPHNRKVRSCQPASQMMSSSRLEKTMTRANKGRGTAYFSCWAGSVGCTYMKVWGKRTGR